MANTKQETGLNKNQIFSQLTRSPHGKLQEYVPVGRTAATQEPEFFAHLVAWNAIKGQIRDAKVALPVLALSAAGLDPEFIQNALAHIATLGLRELLRAYRFVLETKPTGFIRKVRDVVEQRLRVLESNRSQWNRAAVQHRATLKELYALTHTKPSADANAILFKGFKPAGSVFETIANLKNLSPEDAAQAITQRRIPFLIAIGALGAKAKEPALVQALIERMSPTELVTNSKMLEKLGMKNNSALRGAYDAALQRASSSKANVLKTSRAVEAVQDEGLKEKLRGLQNKQTERISVEGDWLILADMSGSMQQSIVVARQIAATIAKLAKGVVTLTFFNTQPTTFDVTNLTLDEIEKKTRHINANGGTSIGCGLQRLLDANTAVDGIVIVSDGGDNTAPYFHDVYKKYAAKEGKDVPVYLFHCRGDNNALASFMSTAGLDMQTFDLTSGTIDYYSLPNLVQTMRTNRYSLVDEVMETPLLTLAEVFKQQPQIEEEAVAV